MKKKNSKYWLRKTMANPELGSVVKGSKMTGYYGNLNEEEILYRLKHTKKIKKEDTPYYSTSPHFYCPKCGVLKAKKIEYRRTDSSWCEPIPQTCSRCGNGNLEEWDLLPEKLEDGIHTEYFNPTEHKEVTSKSLGTWLEKEIKKIEDREKEELEIKALTIPAEQQRQREKERKLYLKISLTPPSSPISLECCCCDFL